MKNWDGLLGWFIERAQADPSILGDPFLKGWHNAVLAEMPDRLKA
jgi:hypothetical protein